MTKNLLYFLTFLLILNCTKKPASSLANDEFEEIKNLIKNSRNATYSDSLRNNYLLLATEKIVKLDNDSLKLRSFGWSSYSHLVLGNMEDFKNINQKILALATKYKDSVSQARSHADLGYYYQISNQSDSAYYFYRKALIFYAALNNELEEGRMLLSMAQIQTAEKDYLGSEINTFKALSKYKNSDKNRSIFSCYYNLGYIANELKNYDKSIEYHNEALTYLTKVQNSDNLYLMTINGIGNAYLMKNDYVNAIKYYERGLNFPNIYRDHPLRFARFTDNKAYSKLQMGNNTELPQKFYEALHIRDSLGNREGIIQSNLNLAKYYIHTKQELKARERALNAEKLSKDDRRNSDLLVSYELLSNVIAGEEGKTYLRKHIQLTDSLQLAERVTREKFTRIAYETDEIIQEKEVETKRKWWLVAFLGSLAVVSGLIFMNMRQRSKNKDLKFNRIQEEANIEIYNLMISQQQKFQDGSNEEKKRISEELHDGVLGRLFGTRLSLDSLNDGNSEKDIEERETYIAELQSIEEDIRKISHNLSNQLFSTSTNFVKMVEELVEKQSKISNFEYKITDSADINWDEISNKIKIHCYRTFQEALQNINKYAQASKVEIAIRQNSGKLFIEIQDDGVGFDQKKKSKGIGIKNIRSRVERLQGTVTFVSSNSNGTCIHMTVPIR